MCTALNFRHQSKLQLNRARFMVGSRQVHGHEVEINTLRRLSIRWLRPRFDELSRVKRDRRKISTFIEPTSFTAPKTDRARFITQQIIIIKIGAMAVAV